jgi:uncharacterized protein YbjT (DUF2867 family)
MSMSDRRTVMVTGATGAQGGAVCHALLAAGHNVRGYVRNADSAAAQRLRAAGAELAVGAFDDGDALRRALAGADMAYVMGTPWEEGTTGEQRQVRSTFDACQASGVGHVIYSSCANANRNTKIAWYEAKFELETDLTEGRYNFDWTIAGPAVFMQILRAPHALQGLAAGLLAVAVPETYVQTWIDVRDIGSFVAHVVGQPAPWTGQRVDLASEMVSGAEAARILSQASGREIRYQQVPLETIAAFNKDIAEMYEWFGRVGMSVDVGALHARTPEVRWTTFREWANREDWSVLSSLPSPAWN